MFLSHIRRMQTVGRYRVVQTARRNCGVLLVLALLVPDCALSAPPSMEERKAVVFDRLIKEAEKAVEEGRLTTPENNNALDKLRAAGMVRPDNPRVQAGLQAILDAYERLIDESLKDGDYERAGTLLPRLLQVAPKHERAEDFRQQIAELRAAQPAQPAQPPGPDPQGRVWLSPAALRARKEPIIAVLHELAQEVQRGNWSVHIYARTDEEGRWIYKTLKEAVPGYRIRGDIRISATPYVQLMEPLT